MDPFEEFEFKPLTEGLGFHQRQTSTHAPETKPSANPRAKIDFSLELMAPDLMENTNLPQIQPGLPRKESTPQIPSESPSSTRNKSHNPPSTTVDDILKTLGEKRRYDFAETTTKSNNFQKTAVKELYKSSAFELSAALLDAMLVIAGFLGAMIVLLVVTKADLLSNLINADEDGFIYLGLLAMLMMTSWIYLVTNRLFLGYTPGEWVFDQRMGWPEQLGTARYGLLVAARSVIVVATGFLIFPLISLVTGKDWLGQRLGIELIKKVS